MLALALSAILLLIASPLYERYIMHAQRNRAETALLQLAAKLEMYFSDQATYENATLDNLHANQLTEGIPYHLNIAQISDAHFTIEVVPQDAQAKRDAHCGTLSLNEKNERALSGDGDVKQCWR